MTHYNHILCFNRLKLDVHLGFYDDERAKLQPIEFSMRLYFPEAPAATTDDKGAFFDYSVLCAALTELATGREHRLIEFLAMEGFRTARAIIDEAGGTEVKLWLMLNKCTPPVKNLLGGGQFIHSDLPPGATTVAMPIV